jgi:predicted nucleic acid-binding protein
MAPRELVIDSCCMINLLATRCELEIVRALHVRLLDTTHTSIEPTALWTAPDDQGRRGRTSVSTNALREAGLLVTRPLDTAALRDAFVRAAEQIGAADASCIALAGVRGLPLVTDDRKERRVALELFPALELRSTLDLLHDAGQALAWDDDRLARVAADLRWRGNFAPPRQDARAGWYAALLRRASEG